MPVDRRRENHSIPSELERRKRARRKFIRSEVTLTVIELEGEKRRKRFLCHDLSTGGMFIENPFPLPLDRVVDLEIKLPGIRPIHLKGEVTSVISPEGNVKSVHGRKIIELEENNLLLTSGNGIAFPEISKEYRNDIERYLKSLESKQ